MQAVRYLHGHELQQFAETDILRGLHPAVAPDDALDLPDQEVGFVQPSVEGCLGRVPADVGVIFQFVLYFDQILGRDQGAHLQVVHRKLVQVHRGYEEVRVRDDVFVDLALAVGLEDRLVSQLILESCHHQSRHAESAGADNADTDFAGVLFVFFDSLLRRAEVHGQESDFRLVDLVSGLLRDHGGRPAAGLEDLSVLLFDIVKDRVVDPKTGRQSDKDRTEVDQKTSEEFLVLLEFIGDVAVIDVDHPVDHREDLVVAQIAGKLFLLSGVGHLGASDVQEHVGELSSGDLDLKLLLHRFQNAHRQVVVIPELKISHLRRNTVKGRALLQPLNNNGYMDDQSRVGAVGQLQDLGLVELAQDLVHSAHCVALEQGIDPAVRGVKERLREDLSGDIAAAVCV